MATKKVYLSYFDLKTSPVYFCGKVIKFQEKYFVDPEICSNNYRGGGGEKHPTHPAIIELRQYNHHPGNPKPLVTLQFPQKVSIQITLHC